MERDWYKKWPEGIPKTISYPEVPLHQLLVNSAEKHPDTPAIFFEGNEITFRRLNELTDRFANALEDLGVRKGDKVALFLPNLPQFVVAYYGALKAGATVTPLNPMYKEREAEFQLNNAEAETIVALDIFFDVIHNIRSKTKLRNAILTNIKDFLPGMKKLIGPLVKKELRKRSYPDTLDFMQLINTHPARPPSVEIDPKQDLAVLQYTGGTTGVPKGAMISHFNLVSNAMQAASWLPVQEGREIVICALPLFHIYGMTVAMNVSIYSANPMIVLVDPRDIEKILKSISDYKATLFPGVPAMYVACINHPNLGKYDLTSIKKCISGAAPLPVAVMNTFNELTNGDLVEGYGLTEASPITHCNPLDSKEKVKPATIGIPVPDTEAKIVDLETGTKDLGIGEAGEMVIRGPQVMLGYWKNPEETKIALRNGWLYTGDIAEIDEDGYFAIVDRKKDMIDRAGYKIWPREVEEMLYEHPAIKDAAVIGVPDARTGEAVKAFVVLKEGEKATVDEIRSFCKERIAAYKVPAVVEFTSELPKTMVGKVLRRALRQQKESESSET
ncbi:MAG: long-chain fatty acid--CoA ligase [Aigarchaeota archaeon]|nr:long-chain fatty acid--CoA ligase [Aigarchaeota archaeon]